MSPADVSLEEPTTQLASDLAIQTDINRLETTLLDVTLLDPQSAALALARLAENQSQAAARLAHRVFTVYETTLLKEFLKQKPVEGIAMDTSDLSLTEARLSHEGGEPTERLSKLSGPVERLRDVLRTKSLEPASILSPQSLIAYKDLCEKMKAFVSREDVDRVLFTDNLQKLTEANPKLKIPTLGLGMEMVDKWRGQVPTIGGGTINLKDQVKSFAQSLT